MKKLLKKISLLLLTATAAFGLIFATGCAKSGQTLTLGILGDVDSVPFMIAKQQGYLPENIVLEKFNSAPDRDTALQTGAIDGAVSDVLAACLATSGGFEVKITSMTNGMYKLVAGKDSGAASIADLEGKDVAISKNTIIEFALDAMLSKEGLGDTVEKAIVPQIPVRLEMLNANQVASALLPEPFASSAIQSGGVVLGSSGEMGVNPGVLLFTKKAIDNKQAEIRSLYEAYNKAVDYIGKTDREVYIDNLIADLGFPENIRDVLVFPTYTKAVLPEEQQVTGAAAWLFSHELITEEYSYEQLVDSGFCK